MSLCKAKFRRDIATSSQDCGFKRGYGAFTGELSVDMLKDAGINWTLTGHSERRVGFGYAVRLIHVILCLFAEIWIWLGRAQ